VLMEAAKEFQKYFLTVDEMMPVQSDLSRLRR
jgi:hypothetical protein